MGDHGLEVGGQVDDVNRSEGTFLGADTAADAQSFTYIRNLRLGSDLRMVSDIWDGPGWLVSDLDAQFLIFWSASTHE